MSTLRRLLGVATVVDDRAQRVEIVTSAEMLAPLTPLQRVLLWRWLSPVVVLAVLATLVAVPEIAGPLVMVFPIVGFFVIGSRERKLAALSRGALAAGLCGGCGYRIDDQHLQADQRRVCPECGGAWVANAAPPPPAEADVLFRRNFAAWYSRTRVGTLAVRDHRGMIMPCLERTDPEERRQIHAICTHGQTRVHGFFVGPGSRRTVGVLLGVSGTLVVAVQFDSTPSGSLFGFLVFLFGLLMVGAGCVLHWSGRDLAGRVAILRAGLCPACTLPISGATPEADGCVKCPSCWAAWRATDIGTTPSTLRREP